MMSGAIVKPAFAARQSAMRSMAWARSGALPSVWAAGGGSVVRVSFFVHDVRLQAFACALHEMRVRFLAV